MIWHDLLEYYDRAIEIERFRMKRVHKVIIMVPKR